MRRITLEKMLLRDLMLRLCFWTLILLCSLWRDCFCRNIPFSQGYEEEIPWFTGPILTPTASVVPVGHFNIEPYLFWLDVNGKYKDNWSVDTKGPKFFTYNSLILLSTGIYKNLDIKIIPQTFYNYSQGEHSSGFGDLSVTVGYQLYQGTKEQHSPFLKISVQELFPTGKYQKLKSHKFGTDATGRGSYTTQINLIGSMLFHFGHHHFLRIRGFAALNLHSTVHVKGINIHGGDETTKGRVHPEVSYYFLASAEYSLTQQWVLACELSALGGGRIRFKGKTISPVGSPSSVQFSATPSIEYNWNEHWGLIIGSWFTFAGRNSNRFIGGAGALNIYY